MRPIRRLFDRFITSRGFLSYQAGAMDRCLHDPEVAKLYEGHEFVLFRRHYYLPLPDAKDISFLSDSDLVGVAIDDDACFEFHKTFVQPFDPEFRDVALANQGDIAPLGFHLINGSFMAIDGNMYYGLIRSMAPGKIIEIGSGNSTRLACLAIRKNVAEGRRASELVCIEPFHAGPLRELLEVTSFIESYVQEVDLSVFEALQAGDILFIDSTHTVRPGGDVAWEICEILPRLKPGVLVHVHDISLPKPYPSHTLANNWYWMEQYMLQAFLTFNEKVSILWPGNYLMVRHEKRMRSLFEPEYSMMRAAFPLAEPASFWMRIN